MNRKNSRVLVTSQLEIPPLCHLTSNSTTAAIHSVSKINNKRLVSRRIRFASLLVVVARKLTLSRVRCKWVTILLMIEREVLMAQAVCLVSKSTRGEIPSTKKSCGLRAVRSLWRTRVSPSSTRKLVSWKQAQAQCEAWYRRLKILKCRLSVLCSQRLCRRPNLGHSLLLN